MNPSSNGPIARLWPDYRTVWRWHFYAGLVCLPFVVVLAITGIIYLFKIEIENWQEQSYNYLRVEGPVSTAQQQIGAALLAMPSSQLKAYEPPVSARHAARVVVSHNGHSVRVFVHPQTLQILGQVNESDRFMRFVFRMHGELLLGDTGSIIVELAASWTIVLILTGLFLWWPRQSRGLAGVLYPRLAAGQRVFWRDVHSVTGVYISVFTLVLLISGLPWSKVWGDYLRTVRQLTGTAVSAQDWQNRAAGNSVGGGGEHGSHSASGRPGPTGGDHSEHGAGSRAATRGASSPPIDYSVVDTVLTVLQDEVLEAPVVISPPMGTGSIWTVKSMTANRPWRVTLKVDAASGQVDSREGFWDRHWIDRTVAVGIAAHEGRLFGWPNQLLGLLTALGLVVVCVSGAVMWWRRRDAGTLGAPAAGGTTRVGPLLACFIALLGLLLPLFGISLVVMLLLEYVVLRRIGPVRRWLGLRQV